MTKIFLSKFVNVSKIRFAVIFLFVHDYLKCASWICKYMLV